MLERGPVSILFCCVLVAACARFDEALSPPPAPAVVSTVMPPPPPDSELLSWLSAYQTLANAPPEEQRKAYLAAQAAFAKVPHDGNRLRLALALSLPALAWRDESRLLSLLEPARGQGKMPDSPRQQLAFLLYRQVQERQRLREELRRCENGLLEELGRSEALQLKLEALRRIDQDIKQRKHPLESPP